MSKHTPGPWKCVSTLDGIYGIYVAKDTKEFTPLADTCHLYLPIEECLGNARIMAAAPDMEDWIRAALKQFEEQAQVIINHDSIIDDADKFKEEPIVKLILSGRDILSRVKEDEAE